MASMKKNLKIGIVGGTELSAAKVAEKLIALDKDVEIIDINSESYKEYQKAIMETADHLFTSQPKTFVISNPYEGLENVYGGATKKQMNAKYEPVRTEPKIQNNEPCPCGSGLKYKKCCKNQ